jgi:hypothetical protein
VPEYRECLGPIPMRVLDRYTVSVLGRNEKGPQITLIAQILLGMTSVIGGYLKNGEI